MGAISDEDFLDLRALDAALDGFCRACATGDWPAIHAYAAAHGERGDWGTLVAVAAGQPQAQEHLAARWARQQTDTVAGVLYGSRLVGWAWEARSDSLAKDVSAEQFQRMHERLHLADQVLIEVTARAPGDGVAWAIRQNVGLGLGLGESEVRRRFRRAGGVSAAPWRAKTALLNYLLPKWYGSWEKAESFVAENVEAAKPGSHDAGLPLYLQVERWPDAGSGPGLDAFLSSADLRVTVDTAAANSILHPDYQANAATPELSGLFALLYSLMGDQKAAAVFFRSLGQAPPRWGWMCFGDPVGQYRKRRTTALEQG